MATYLVLNIIFCGVVLALLRPRIRRPSHSWTLMAAVLLVLTAIFDSLIIWAGIVGYDMHKILGIYVGLAPIEDFFYAVFAAVIVPLLWNKFGGSHDRSN